MKALKYIAAGVDGGYGAHTELAVKYFQKRNGLSESGQCDQATLECMYSNAAVESGRVRFQVYGQGFRQRSAGVYLRMDRQRLFQ